MADVQKYVADRLQETYRGRPISVDTIRKEIAISRIGWNWAQERLEILVPHATRGAKPLFMTSGEVLKTTSLRRRSQPYLATAWGWEVTRD